MIQSGVADPGPGYTAWEAAVQAPVANMVIYDNFEAYHLIATNTTAMNHAAKDHFKTKITNKLLECKQNGVTPYLKWAPKLSGFGEGESSRGRIYNAILDPMTSFDNYIHWYATQLKEAFHDTGITSMYIEFAPQMNSPLEPYGGPVNEGGGAEFVKVWKRVHTILKHYGPQDNIVQDGRDKVMQFVWTISTDANAVSYTGLQFSGASFRQQHHQGDQRQAWHDGMIENEVHLTDYGFENYYPGDDYVDFTGMTVFSNDGDSFDNKASAAYARMVIAAAKPIFLSELAVSTSIPGQTNNAAAWITAAMSDLTTKYTNICGFNYYSHGVYDISTTANADSAEALRVSQADATIFTATADTEQTLDCSPNLHLGPHDVEDRAYNSKKLSYNPTSSKSCCTFKCNAGAACIEGCDMWLRTSSLNWESEHWRDMLQGKCHKQCDGTNEWSTYQHSFGHTAGYFEAHSVADETLCKVGCDNYRSCF
jgi:hypothetical protein